MVKVTVVLCTKRYKPCFESALRSLKNQTYKDFEYIIIDGIYNNRKDDVDKLINDVNVSFPIMYLPDKYTRWKGRRPALCNARNTAIMFAKGEYIVFHDDGCRLYPDWIEKHVKWLEQGYLVAGNWISFQDTDSSGKGIIGVFGWEHRSKIVKESKVVTAGWLYGGNFSFPLKAAIDINGFDERYDGEMGQDDIDFGFRAERKGYAVMYDPSCCLEYHYKNMGPGSLVSYNDPPINIVLNDGNAHFSNEFLTQELLDDNNRYLPRGNNFNLAEMRKMVIEKEYNIEKIYNILELHIDPDPYDWRDRKLISEKI